MNNFTNAFTRFIKNKNTVTIVLVIVILAILYFGYNLQIQNAVTPIKGIPVAKQTIQPRTEITSDMIEEVDIAPILLRSNVLRTRSLVVGKYTNVNTLVPAGSMFYTQTLVTSDALPDSAFVEVGEGKIPYNFPVNMENTYGNSIFVGNIIDIYMKAINDEGQVMVGKLIENVKVLAVKDSSGRNVFENSEESRTPSTFIFGVTPEIHILLRKASFMQQNSVVLFPIPRGGVVTETGTIQVSTAFLQEFINAKTVTIAEDAEAAPITGTN